MSYLEGDSLLREIEKSIEQEELEGGVEDNDDDIDDDDVLLEVPSAIDGCTDTEHEAASIGPIAAISVKQISSKDPSATKSKKTSSNAKSSSITRPSSSITNHTS